MTRFAAVFALALALPASGRATPRPMAFSYGVHTQPAGALELEQYVDVVPMRVERVDPATSRVDTLTRPRYALQTEIEYGVTDQLEAAFYTSFLQDASPGDPSLRLDGIKQRVRLRLFPLGMLPVDIALYGEIAEFHDEIEFEEKIILERDFGPLRLAVNLWVEQELGFEADEVEFIYNPTAGATFAIDPRFWVGLEYWARGRFGGSEEEEEGTHHYAGPTLSLQTSNVWLTVAMSLRLDGLGDDLEIGDPFGKLWFRALLGVSL